MPKPLAHEAIHDTIAQILTELPRGHLLDVPAGEGALSLRLMNLGYEVECCDLYPEIFALPDVEVKRGDLAGTLPFSDHSFDYVVCIEGLEHLENPHQAIREFRRLIRPGGHLLLSIPNILNIEERLKWLLYGYTSHFKPLSREHIRGMSEQAGGREEVVLHINPIAYSELRYVLEKHKFRIVRLYRDKPKKNLWVYRPLVGLIRIVNGLLGERKKRERWSTELHSDEVLLGGNTLIIHAIDAQSEQNRER
jgi:SAM-dependent methyltransferase